jgi:hypothetical protein
LTLGEQAVARVNIKGWSTTYKYGGDPMRTAEERAIINDAWRRAYAMQAAVLTQEQGEIVEAAALCATALPRPECCVFTAAENLCNYMLVVAFRASEIDAATGGAPVGRA